MSWMGISGLMGEMGVTVKPIVSIINGFTLVVKANIDKRCNTSSIIDPFIKLHEWFDLSIQQAIEVLTPIGWATELTSVCLVQWQTDLGDYSWFNNNGRRRRNESRDILRTGNGSRDNQEGSQPQNSTLDIQ
jgi:hypothetical protein